MLAFLPREIQRGPMRRRPVWLAMTRWGRSSAVQARFARRAPLPKLRRAPVARAHFGPTCRCPFANRLDPNALSAHWSRLGDVPARSAVIAPRRATRPPISREAPPPERRFYIPTAPARGPLIRRFGMSNPASGSPVVGGDSSEGDGHDATSIRPMDPFHSGDRRR